MGWGYLDLFEKKVLPTGFEPVSLAILGTGQVPREAKMIGRATLQEHNWLSDVEFNCATWGS